MAVAQPDLLRRIIDAQKPTLCGWCLVSPATTTVHAVASCASCAGETATVRVQRWMSAVQGRRR
jgi:hypothetical protein